MMQNYLFIVLIVCITTKAFQNPAISSNSKFNRIQPLNENFFLDVAEDPVANTPKELLGEVAYKTFTEKTVPNGLLNRKYDIIERLRELKLLTLTAESGLLEALEKKGLTLSQVERLLPIIDDLGLLPFAAKNKGLVLSLAPLLIEPAPLLIPVVVSVLKNPAALQIPGFLLLAAGGYEVINNNVLLAGALLLLGLPLTAIGSLASGSVALPAVQSAPVYVAPKITAPSIALPVLKAEPPKVKTVIPGSNDLNGKRKTVKVRAGR